MRVRRVRRMRQPAPAVPARALSRGRSRPGAVEIGTRTIDVADIVGTAVGGGDQRGGDFLPLKPFRGQNWHARWQRLRRAQDRPRALPTIDVVKYADKYWVVDGHNRVALALYGGQQDIDASIVELVAPGRHRTEPLGSLAAEVEATRPMRARAAAEDPTPMIRRLTIDWPDARSSPTATAGRSAGWSCPTSAIRPSSTSSTATASAAIDTVVGCGDLEPDYLGFLSDAFGVPVEYVRGNHDRGGRWARVGRGPGAGTRCRPAAWHRVDGVDLVALEWPGVRHGDRMRHDRTAWADILRAALGRLPGWRIGRGRGPLDRDQPRAAARRRRPGGRCVPRRVRRLPLVAGPRRSRRCGCTATCRRRASRAGASQHGPSHGGQRHRRGPRRVPAAPRRVADRSERRPGDRRPRRGGEREATRRQQPVDATHRRPHLRAAEQLAQLVAELAVEPPPGSVRARPARPRRTARPRQPHRTVRSLGTIEKHTPWSTP